VQKQHKKKPRLQFHQSLSHTASNNITWNPNQYRFQIKHGNPLNKSLLLPAHDNTGVLGLLLSRLAGSPIPTADRFVLLLVPLPHFCVSQVLLVLPLPGSVQAQAAVGFDDAAKGHAGHLDEAVVEVSTGFLRRSSFLLFPIACLGLDSVMNDDLHFKLKGQATV
jgi:hypothetical protein